MCLLRVYASVSHGYGKLEVGIGKVVCYCSDIFYQLGKKSRGVILDCLARV